MDRSAYVSAFDLFSVGIGPSSSHTVGPMRAARRFSATLVASGAPDRVARIECDLFGSLGATGLGHGTPDAVVAGLLGHDPETVDPSLVRGIWTDWTDGATLSIGDRATVPFRRDDIRLRPHVRVPGQPNTLTLRAFAPSGEQLLAETYYSVGGGFIVRDDEAAAQDEEPAGRPERYPVPFGDATALLDHCERTSASIAQLARRNELSLRQAEEVDAGLDAIAAAMDACIDAGLSHNGVLPGGLNVRRRASSIRAQLESRPHTDPSEWLGVFALAVNEENAAGGRVVTAPTNGAAGIVPAVLRYWSAVLAAGTATAAGTRDFLLTATAIGSIIKANASISGAAGGCQAEVGSACAMAAAGLTAVLGGSPRQVENAAEIAVEHHLGLTCDPVAGLVQIPCIERNAIAASTAVAAARLALRGDGSHAVSFDTVVETMRQTGEDMSMKYKETSLGGLAVNVVEC
ncbi:L-serine ammonia-lyase [Leifsonia naganoensis]|uniref:L-serine dehydratase n=1 Tax=Leifsonia naganoensis TaxID=150025 RepID=A0A853DR27_9MICO|nr:L-serine dehydratase [Leifsonia naganoensis]